MDGMPFIRYNKTVNQIKYKQKRKGVKRMDVKRIQEGRRKVRFTYNVEQELLDEIKILAIARHQRVNELMDDILINFVNEVKLQREENGEGVIPNKLLYL